MKKKVFLTYFLVSLTLFVTVRYWKPSMIKTASRTAVTNRDIQLHQPKFIPGGQSLSPQVINGVKKFMFFVGYSRSGHSIIGSLMDAHPHVVIAHEFYIFEKIPLLDKARSGSWKDDLFDKLYQKSVRDVSKLRADSVKGYTLGVEGLWQGKFDKYIEVLGDKGGAHVTLEYLENKERFISNYHKLQKELSIPIRIIHAIRNPFDMVATNTAWESNKSRFLKMKGALYSNESKREELSDEEKISANYITNKEIFVKFKMVNAVVEMIDIFGKENVLEVHNCDLVNDPRGTISKIFNFLEVEASPHYLDVCAEKVFKSVSRSRDLIKWTEEQRKRVERRMKNYPMFGAEVLIQHIHSLGIPAAIATGSALSSYKVKVSKYGHLFDAMSHAVCSDDPSVKEGKPAPYIYQVAAARFKDPPKSSSNVLVFEDAPNGLESAKAAGMNVVMVPDKQTDPQKCLKADSLLRSLEDLDLAEWGLLPIS